MNSFAMSVLAALALRPIMGAEETSVVRLDRQAEQEAFEGRSARSRRVAVHFSTEVRAVLADTKVPMRSLVGISRFVARAPASQKALETTNRVPATSEVAPLGEQLGG